MVTKNVETDLDIANGAQEEVVGIILHPKEPEFQDKPVIRLGYLPTCIFVKMQYICASKPARLEEGVIPIEPGSTTFRVTIPMENGGNSV